MLPFLQAHASSRHWGRHRPHATSFHSLNAHYMKSCMSLRFRIRSIFDPQDAPPCFSTRPIGRALPPKSNFVRRFARTNSRWLLYCTLIHCIHMLTMFTYVYSPLCRENRIEALLAHPYNRAHRGTSAYATPREHIKQKRVLPRREDPCPKGMERACERVLSFLHKNERT